MAVVHDRLEYRNRRHVFADRAEAGRILAVMLAPSYGPEGEGRDAVVAAIPSGGVPVGLEICQTLRLPLDVVVVRKIPIPGNTEAGFGAVSLSGARFLNRGLMERLGLGEEDADRLALPVQDELRRREELFRRGAPPADFGGRPVILADDGLASGYTMLAALAEVRERGAIQAVVAVPTAPASTVELIGQEANEIYCPNVREGYPFAVANAYQEWRDLEREEVLALLDQAGKDGLYPPWRMGRTGRPDTADPLD